MYFAVISAVKGAGSSIRTQAISVSGRASQSGLRLVIQTAVVRWRRC